MATPTSSVPHCAFHSQELPHSAPAHGLGSRVAPCEPQCGPQQPPMQGQCPAEPQAQPQLIAWAPGEQVGAQPRRPCRRSQQPVSHDHRSHYSSLSCKQLSIALIRATEEHRELSPLRVRGCVSSWGGAVPSYWNGCFPPGPSSRKGEPSWGLASCPALSDQGPPAVPLCSMGTMGSGCRRWLGPVSMTR